MPLPRLLHPIQVTVQQIDRDATIYDEETREPVQKVQRKIDTTLSAQVSWGRTKDLNASAGGVREEADGYVVFRYVDLAAKQITLQLNDRLIKMGHVVTDVYLIKLQPFGHYGDQNGPALIKAFFASRESSRQGLDR